MNDEITQRLYTRKEVCHIRKRGRTAQIADENSGRWPAPVMYRGRTPLWTTEEVKRALEKEMADLVSATEKTRSDMKQKMQICIKGRIQKVEDKATAA